MARNNSPEIEQPRLVATAAEQLSVAIQKAIDNAINNLFNCGLNDDELMAALNTALAGLRAQMTETTYQAALRKQVASRPRIIASSPR
jgi:hypothetical protein